MKLWLYNHKFERNLDYWHYLVIGEMVYYEFNTEWISSARFYINDEYVLGHNRIFQTDKVGYFVFDTNLTIDSTLEEIDIEIKRIFPEIYL